MYKWPPPIRPTTPITTFSERSPGRLCAFGVVVQAEHLAERLGDPYGTLVLTLPIVVIEVILISAVMLGPGEHATIARDSVMAATMIVLTLVVGTKGAYQPAQEIPIIVLTLVLYGFFLYRQTGSQNTDFQQVISTRSDAEEETLSAQKRPGITTPLKKHRTEVIARILLLLATVIPIVLLSHDMATLLDNGLGRIGAPTALSGGIIALI